MGRRASGAPRALGAAAAVQACIVLAASLLASTVGPRDLAMRLTLIGSLAVAMGGQNAVVRRLAVPDLTTTVLTLTVTGLVADTTPQSVRGRRLISVLAMLASARPVELGAPADRAGCSPTSPIRTWRTGRSLLREQLPPPGADQGPLRRPVSSTSTSRSLPGNACRSQAPDLLDLSAFLLPTVCGSRERANRDLGTDSADHLVD
jgi:hypothetical protein